MRSFSPWVRRRTSTLRLEQCEQRIAPALGLGANFASFGSNSVPALGNSGAVGPNHYVQFLIGQIAIYGKDGTLLANTTDSAFWASLGVSIATLAQGLGEPRVVYDELSDRWFAMEISLASTNNEVLLARSDTSDPTGTWKSVSYLATSGQYGGFPTLGVDANGVYVGTANFFSTGLPIPNGVTMTAIPKADLLATTPTVANRNTLNQGANAAMGWSPQVVTNVDSSATQAMILATHYTNFNLINRTSIDWNTGTSTFTYGSSSNLAIGNTSLPGKSRQPDGTRILSGGDDDRYAGAIYQVGDLVYAAHPISVNAAGAAVTSNGASTNAVHLVVIRASTGTVAATYTYFNSAFDYSFPSVAANEMGDIVMGLNRSGFGATGNVGAYAVHLRIDPSNPTSISFVEEIELKAGLANNYNQQGSTLEAWGPYSSTTRDPSHPLAFWTSQEYTQSDFAWGTQISQIFVAPRIGVVTSSAADSLYGVGAIIPITVQFNFPVDVTGTPLLLLNSGGTAQYLSGSGTDTLTFQYTVGNGENASDLDYASAAALSLNGGTITDSYSNHAAELTLPATGSPNSLGGSKNIAINTTVPTVTGVTSPLADGTYGFNAVVQITIAFDRTVIVSGVPQVALNTGGVASYISGSGTNTLTFEYTVGAGENTSDLDYASASAFTLNGGSIIDSVNAANASLALADPGTAGSLGANKNLVIDAVSATVVNVTSSQADGSYAVNTQIDIRVQFNKPVNVVGTPQLALNSGGTANYLSGSGSTSLTFRYTVGSGESTADLDYTTISGLSLNGGTIQEASGLNANLTLPTVGAMGSLGFNKNIAIDGVGPNVVEFRVLFGSRRYDILGSTRTNLPWRVKGIQVVFDEVVTTGNRHSLNGVNAITFTGKNTKILTWKFRPISKGSFNTALEDLGANALLDSAGNPIPAFSQAFNVLYGDFDDNSIVNADDRTAVRALVSRPYQLNPVAYNIFADLSGDGIVNLIDAGIARARRGQTLP